ncbi:hypothetical protein Q669_31630 [Labrenzia sp. C1B10]|nr:hypothetical protein Q669_31630 [Labrenzia sp. C1B10]ERS02552.1 hypothetical protein Q675_32085 [Labrenzia sp. C1B70]
MFAAIDQDTIALVNRHPAMRELAVFAYSVNRAIGFTETVDHEFPRPFAVFPILKEAVVVVALPVPVHQTAPATPLSSRSKSSN